MKLGVSTYSYWHFTPEKVPVETVIEKAAALGLDGVEILHRQMDAEEPRALQQLKRQAFLNGLDLYALSIHQGFVTPDREQRRAQVRHTVRCIELAHELGVPAIRLNSGRWGTVRSFTELMERRGVEPILPGYTEEDGFRWVVEAIEACLPFAERYGVLLALENHWGLTATAQGVLRILKAVDSPWLQVTMDCGNFLEETYQQLEAIAPYAVLVHAKTYYGGGEWYTLELDYERIFRMLQRVGFRGYISIEFEGKEDPDQGVPRSVEMLRAAIRRVEEISPAAGSATSSGADGGSASS
ncbi:MAG: xylose isomerase [Candidatus Poribacteria bacterium]|nr:MAG: xylose isomerase [Candidatus Poribacteria bacterium]